MRKLTRRTMIGALATPVLGWPLRCGEHSDALARVPGSTCPGCFSILGYGARRGEGFDNTAPIQRAINAANGAGGGVVFIPAGRFYFTDRLVMRSGVSLRGLGPSSELHFLNERRRDAIYGEGTRNRPLRGLRLQNFALSGGATFKDGTPSVINGGGINLIFVDDSEFHMLSVSGFSDGGLFVLNGNRNKITDSLFRNTGQGCGFTANAIDCYENEASRNRIDRTGTYNGLHLEGSFGDHKGDGKLYATKLAFNRISNSRECGMNIELAPQTLAIGNEISSSGLGRTQVDMGIKIFGSPGTELIQNSAIGSRGFGVVVGANSGNSKIESTTTDNNSAGSILVTDSSYLGGEPTATTMGVRLVANKFRERVVKISGNASVI